MRLNGVGLDLALNPTRESIILVLFASRFPKCRDIAIYLPLGASFRFLYSWIDPTRNDVLNLDKIIMRTPVGDERDSLGIELLLEAGKSVLHRARPHHNALLVIAHGGEDRFAAIEHTTKELELGSGRVLKLVKKHDGICKLQSFENRRVLSNEQLNQPIEHRKRERDLVIVTVLSMPILGDCALKL